MNHTLRQPHLLRRTAVLGLCLTVALLFTAGSSRADGTEELGAPSIVIAPGTGVAVGGVGLIAKAGYQPVSVNVPAGASVQQVLLYWTTEYANLPASANLILNNTTNTASEVTQAGAVIGGTTLFFNTPVATYRADITSKGWIVAGANTIYVKTDLANGLGILVIYDDGTGNTVSIRDGQDITFFDEVEPLKTTVPQTFSFPASTQARDVKLSFFATGFFAGSLPNVLEVTVGGVTTSLNNFFEIIENAPNYAWDVKTLTVTVPAGVTDVTVRALSRPSGSGGLPGKLATVMASVTVPNPGNGGSGCTFTWGYWKNHSTFGNASHKRDAGWDNLPQAENTPFFLSGQTYAQILEAAVKGNRYYALAHQYAAAHLNRLGGTTGTQEVTDAFNAATTLFETYTPAQVKAMKSSDPVRKQIDTLNDILDSFNNGNLGVGHCDSVAGSNLAGGDVGAFSISGSLDVPAAFELAEAYPNPFNPSTQIGFSLPEASNVRLAVYDLLGREVALLVDGQMNAGNHAVTFQADNLPSGTYLYRLLTPQGAFTKTVVLLK